MSAKIIVGDMRSALGKLDAGSVHACVTDPPYHFGSVVKRFAKTGGGDRQESRVGAYTRHAKGFMGKAWDGGDIAFQPDTWVEVLRVLKPGGHLVAFGGTKGFHRMACAIEDAGFEIRDTLMWIYGSGFPKSHNQKGEWEGWGTALKPAYEPIVLARKALDGSVAANLAKHGTGAINVDGCRIEGTGNRTFERIAGDRPRDQYRTGTVSGAAMPSDIGRWPANVVHDGSEEVLQAFPDAPGQLADASTSSSGRVSQRVYGAMKRGNGRDKEASGDKRYTDSGATNFAATPGTRRGDEGSAARFFYCAKADRDERNLGLTGFEEKPLLWSSGEQSPGTFQAEGTKRAAQNNHPTVKPVALMQWLVRLVTPKGGLVLDPFMGSGSTGIACDREGANFIGVEQDEGYAKIAEARLKGDSPMFADVQTERAA